MADGKFIYKMLDEALASAKPDEELETLHKEGFLEFAPAVLAMVGFGGGDTGHKDLWGHTKQVVAQTIPKHPLRWAALYHDVGKVQCFSTHLGKVSFHQHEFVSARLFVADAKAMYMPEDIRDQVRFLIAHLGLVESYDPSWTDSAVRRLAKDVGENFDDLVALSRADITTKHANKRAAHHARIHAMVERFKALAEADATPPALPSGLGDAIKVEFGIPESPFLGKMMKGLKAEVEAGRLPRNGPIEVYLKALREANSA